MRVFYLEKSYKDAFISKGITVKVYPDQDCPAYRMVDVRTSKGTYQLYEIKSTGCFVYRCRVKNIGLMFRLDCAELLFATAEEADSYESEVHWKYI